MSDINELNQGLRWYVVHTYSGYENKVKTNLEKIVENRNLGESIKEIRVPVQIETVTNDKGETKEVEVKLFPAYVFVKMEMTDETWHVVRNITGVTGFVGPGSKPVPLEDSEVEMFNVETRTEEFTFKIGDKVSIVSGMFEGYEGTITDINKNDEEAALLVPMGMNDLTITVGLRDIRIKAE